MVPRQARMHLGVRWTYPSALASTLRRVTRHKEPLTPVSRWQGPRQVVHTCTPLTRSNASPFWPSKQLATVKQAACLELHTPSETASNWSASRLSTVNTKRWSQSYGNTWATAALMPRGPKGRRCQPKKPSRMRSAVAASVSGRRRVGIAYTNRTRGRPSRRRGAAQQGHRHPAIRVAADRAIPPASRLQQARPDLPRTTRPGSRPPLTATRPRAGPTRNLGTQSPPTSGRVGGLPSSRGTSGGPACGRRHRTCCANRGAAPRQSAGSR